MKNSVRFVISAFLLGIIVVLLSVARPQPARSAELGAAFATLSGQIRIQAQAIHERRLEAQRADLVLAGFADQGQGRRLEAVPPSAMYRGNLSDVIPTFKERKDGTYEIDLEIVSRSHAGRYSHERWTSLYFALSAAKIVRDGNNLFLIDGTNRIPVAQTKWWYEPKWYPTRNARVVFKAERSGDGYAISDVALVVR